MPYSSAAPFVYVQVWNSNGQKWARFGAGLPSHLESDQVDGEREEVVMVPLPIFNLS